MPGSTPEGARPLLDELARRAKEALQPIIEDATRRATAQLMLKDAEAATDLAGRVQVAITAEFWSHPANMRRQLPAAVDVSPVLSAMAVAAVTVFSEFLQSQPGTLPKSD
ncbi:MAG: hypothetical protein KDB50_12020 [Mycobacterium sp.]|nr:hypothetical protein [Mycobacterium sp.]